MIPGIHYKIKYKILGASDNNNRLENYSGYSIQNDEKNIGTLENKNRIEK